MRAISKSVAIAAMLVAAPAFATDVTSGTVAQTNASPKQLGRLSRDGMQSDWSVQKTFPGEINTTTTYTYSAIGVTFATNALQKVYYDITVDDPLASGFASAYNGVYDPTNKALHYLGDAGGSGNYFPGDTRFFDVVVPRGGSLTLVFNQVTNGVYPALNYSVYAFSDTMYDEAFRPSLVPEPATWALMILGFGAIGSAMRRRAVVRTQRATA